MYMTTAVYIGINYLGIVRKSLNLAALFATTTRTVREIDRVQYRAMPPCVVFVTSKSQEEQSSVRRIAFLNAQLSHQKSSHIHSVGAIMTGFVIATDRTENLVRDWLEQIHHRRQFFHGRDVYITISKAGLQSAVEQITSQQSIRILMRVDIINVLAYSIVIRMRVSVMVVSKDKQLY